MIFQLLGVLSAVIFIVGDVPYLRDTILKKTKPQRVTWGVVFLLNCIGFANQYASGADNSLWIFGAAVIMTGLIFAASIRSGVGGYARLDIFSMVASLAGVMLWFIFDSPTFSILMNIFVAVVALIPTFVKARKAPETETRITWLLGTISVALAAVSVGEWNPWLLILPVTSTLLQSYMVYILYIEAPRRKQH